MLAVGLLGTLATKDASEPAQALAVEQQTTPFPASKELATEVRSNAMPFKSQTGFQVQKRLTVITACIAVRNSSLHLKHQELSTKVWNR